MTKWLEIAWAELGTQETSGTAATPAIRQYFIDAGRPDIVSDEVAWCAAFAGACLARAGMPQAIPEDKALLARSFGQIGVALSEPRLGCIAVLSRGSDPIHGHVGFVVGWSDSELVLLGGNQSNSVSVAHYSRARLVALRWPSMLGVAQEVAASSRIVKAAARQKRDGTVTVAAPNIPNPFDGLPDPGALAAKAGELQTSTDQLIAFAAFLGAKWPWLMLGVALYFGGRILWDAANVQGWRILDGLTGKTQGAGGAA